MSTTAAQLAYAPEPGQRGPSVPSPSPCGPGDPFRWPSEGMAATCPRAVEEEVTNDLESGREFFD